VNYDVTIVHVFCACTETKRGHMCFWHLTHISALSTEDNSMTVLGSVRFLYPECSCFDHIHNTVCLA